MKKQKVLTIKDDNGFDISLKEAAKLIEGCKTTAIYNYVKNKGAKSLAEVREIRSNIYRFGTAFYNTVKTYETTEGILTAREVWEIHPHKEDVTIEMIRCRLAGKSGGMNPYLWHPSKKNDSASQYKITLICKKCKRELYIQQFELKTEGKSDRHEFCYKCRGTAENKSKFKKEEVKYGDIVLSSGKRYFVDKCLTGGVSKGLVTAFRMTDNGKVLRRTPIYLDTNWKKVA